MRYMTKATFQICGKINFSTNIANIIDKLFGIRIKMDPYTLTLNTKKKRTLEILLSVKSEAITKLEKNM